MKRFLVGLVGLVIVWVLNELLGLLIDPGYIYTFGFGVGMIAEALEKW
jgi:hypothetical protein